MKRFIVAASAVLAVGLYGGAIAADGAAIFKAKCSPCHGSDGQGTAMAPAFKGNDFVKTSEEAQIAQVIKNGREGAAKDTVKTFL